MQGALWKWICAIILFTLPIHAAVDKKALRRELARFDREIAKGKTSALVELQLKRATVLTKLNELGKARDALKAALAAPVDAPKGSTLLALQPMLAGMAPTAPKRTASSQTLAAREQALHDLAAIYARLDEADEALEYFAKYPTFIQRAALERVAAGVEDPMPVHQRLLALDPAYQGNPRYELAIVRAMEEGGARTEAAERIFDRLTHYVKGSRWFTANELMPRATREAATAFEENARRLAIALDTHKHYELYLNAFPATPYTAEVRAHHAALVFRDGKTRDAADQFFAAYRELAGRPGSQEALRSALASLEVTLGEARKTQGLEPITRDSHTLLREDADATPLEELEARFVSVGNEYLEKYPRAAEAADVLYQQAYLFYLHHDFEPAYTRLGAIWQRHNTSLVLFEASARLSMDILHRRKDWARLSTFCRELMRRSAAGSELRAQLVTTLRRSEMKRIEGLERDGNLHEAAVDYASYATELGPQDIAFYETALLQAGVNFTRAGEYVDAVREQEKFLRVFPSSEHVADVLLTLGKNYEWLADLAGAAGAFERFASTAPTRPQARGVLRWAAIYWAGAGDLRRATAAMERYGDENELLDFYETHGLVDKAVALLRKGKLTADRAARLAELTAPADGKLPGALVREAAALAKQGGASAALNAKLAFWEGRYEAAVALGGEWALGALSRLARAAKDEKAIAYAQQCLEKASEEKILSPWTGECYRVLAERDPKHYPDAHTLYLPPVMTAVLSPKSDVGRTARSAYPFYSSLLFRSAATETRESAAAAMPEPMSYRLLAEMRRAWITRALAAAKTKHPTFAYLNLMRMGEPERAIGLIREAIRLAPEDAALHNLLALTYLETDQLDAAGATWASLVARGGDEKAIWNNLGVVAYLRGRERTAIENFKRAGAWANLAFLALKYHDSTAAIALFDKVTDDGVAVQVGRVSARLQAGEGVALRETIESLVARYEDDPYARIVAARYLIDIEKHGESAKSFLRRYLDAQPGAVDGAFGRALREAAGGRKEILGAR